MMKNRIKKYVFALLFIGFSVTSCLDALDIRQKSEATEDIVYRTIDDLQLGLNSVYRNYTPDNSGNGDGDAILFNDLFTDNLMKGSANAGQGSDMYRWILEANSTVASRIWGNRYGTINYANRVLRAAETLIEPTITNSTEQERFDHIKGQLLAWRAICHYDIFMYYSTSYDIINDGDALSAIIMDYVPEITDQPARNTISEVVAFIKKDLDDARTLLDPSQANDPHRININVIDAFRARLAIAIGEYDLAYDLSTRLLGDYPLADRAGYKDLWQDLGTAELIFGLLRVPGNPNIANAWYTNSTDAGGAPWFQMSTQLYGRYYPGLGDVRIDEVLLDATSDIPNQIYLINKYPGVGGAPLRNDVKVIRSSEMALIAAEAEVRRNNFSNAETILSALIDIRYAPNPRPSAENVVFTNQTDALARILDERRKELCFEGHRYLDLKRFKAGILRDASDAQTFNAQTQMGSTDYRFTLPIPQAEIRGNRSVVQNPVYTNN